MAVPAWQGGHHQKALQSQLSGAVVRRSGGERGAPGRGARGLPLPSESMDARTALLGTRFPAGSARMTRGGEVRFICQAAHSRQMLLGQRRSRMNRGKPPSDPFVGQARRDGLAGGPAALWTPPAVRQCCSAASDCGCAVMHVIASSPRPSNAACADDPEQFQGSTPPDGGQPS